MTGLLHFSEHTLQEAALTFMALVYTTRILWLLGSRPARSARRPRGPGTTKGRASSTPWAIIAMPWAMESTRTQALALLQFVVFHSGVAAAIALSFIIPYGPWAAGGHALARLAIQAITGAACRGRVSCAWCGGSSARTCAPSARRTTTSRLSLLTVWFFFAVLAAPNDTSGGEGLLLAFFLLTAFFLVYVPFSKISHYLYYPFTRYYFGKTHGLSGRLPDSPASGSRPSLRGGSAAPITADATAQPPRSYSTSHMQRSTMSTNDPTRPRRSSSGWAKKLNRQMVGSLAACVHCGMCTDSCHYVLANPDDPTYAPAYKADRIRKLFKRHFDWTGRVFPWWVKAGSVFTDEELEELKDIAFGKCTNCRRCSINCPMGVDFAVVQPHGARPAGLGRRHARGRGRRQQGPVGDRQPDGRAQGGLPRDARVDVRGAAERAGRPGGGDSRSTSRTATSSTRSIRAR